MASQSVFFAMLHAAMRVPKHGSTKVAPATRRRTAPKSPHRSARHDSERESVAKTQPGSPKSPRRRSSERSTDDEGRSRIRLDVDERRAQLVELGLTEFGTRTYEDVSIDLIAQAAGISKGLLYHYFPTKRAFYTACVREAASRLLARMDLPADVPPLERLRAGLDRYLAYVRSHGSAFATLMRSGAFADRELAAVVDETRTTLLRQLTSGMADIFPPSGLSSPLLQIALEGWVGLTEAMSIAWVEACIEAERPRPERPRTKHVPTAPTVDQVRDLLAQALVSLVQSSVR
jgi:AcrR family transcriptional regulator